MIVTIMMVGMAKVGQERGRAIDEGSARRMMMNGSSQWLCGLDGHHIARGAR